MAWQDAFSPPGGPTFDVEDERERRLATQARAGAEWALTALIARYQPTVVRYLTRLCGNQAQARRLAERIFQRMERRLHGPHGAENLRLWLLRASTEAGLDALRHPQSRPAPRLATSGVAGLLPEETGSDPQRLWQSGLRRLRQATATVSRQARPLIWANGAAAEAASAEAPHPAPDDFLDESLDRLDPRDALRHRLVRVTLAELPYGDAQCLALHLVAGLNQAEVAKALGITNSATRKRVVHGLALFSERYTQAVQSLGLPTELGFGDALPRAPVEPEPETAPQPALVIVPSQAPADEPGAYEAAYHVAATPAQEPEAEEVTDSLSGMAYAEASDTLAGADAPPDETEPRWAGAAASKSGGAITRLAADAIIGPIVDALPVSVAAPMLPDTIGLAGPRSIPLAFELSSNSVYESQGITMNWLDEGGLMMPLTFEATAYSDTAITPDDTADDALGFELSPTAFDDYALADEDTDTSAADDAPLTLEPTPAPFSEPLAIHVLAGDDSDERFSARLRDAVVATPAPPAFGMVMRSLEDIWEEVPDSEDD